MGGNHQLEIAGEPKATRRGKNTQTIERAGLILACFSVREPSLSLSDLASKLELNQSTVYRYVATLQAAGLLGKAPRTGHYTLGLKVFELAGVAMTQNELCKQAIDEMDRLCDEVGLLIHLRVLFEGDVLHIAHASPKGSPRVFPTVGRRTVAHCTATGKVLLADLPWDEVRALIDQYGWRPYTKNSIQEFDGLKAALDETRELGYAVNAEERRRNMACIAAPLRDQSGRVVAGLSVTGTPDIVAPEQRGRIVGALRAAATTISFRLGFHDNDEFV